MIKIVSIKTRHPDLSRAQFRDHYESRHVPLGLGFIDRFRWRKYVRNHVVGTLFGDAGFDCLTEFWVASAADQARTSEFVQSAEFDALDKDDGRFLDVTRRLSFECEERVLAGPERIVERSGARRIAMLFTRRASEDAAGFSAGIEELGRRLAAEHEGSCHRVAVDHRVSDEAGELELAAMLSVWPQSGAEVPDAGGWLGDAAPSAILDLELVETPPGALWR